MENPVIVFGANPLGRAAKEIFESNAVVVYGFLDDDKKLIGTDLDEAAVLGTTDDDGYLKLIGKKCEAFVAIDDNRLHRNLVEMLHESRHVQPVNAIHASALLSGKSSMGHGNFVDVGVTVSPGAILGSHCIIQGKALIGVGVRIGDFVQVGTGALLNANVIVEDDVFIGSGVTVVAGVTLGKGARVGAGSVVIGPVGAGETVFGNPAQKVKH